jgi:TonB family protein
MKQCRTIFSWAFVLSLTVHAAVFGGALAFAHYGGFLQGDTFRSITVSLVGEGNAAGARKKIAEQASTVVPSPSAAGIEQPAAVAGPAAEPFREAVMPDLAALPTFPGGGGMKGEDGSGALPGKNAGDSGGGISFDQLQLFRSAIERAKTYPRLAREHGIEGTVLVKFKVLPSGDVETVNVVRSSGVQILDEASVRTVYRAAPMPYVSGWVEVPMVYELK